MTVSSLLAFAACQKKNDTVSIPPTKTAGAAVAVADVELGSAIGADKKITDKKTSFRPTDTIFVSVETTGSAPSATLTARFKYGDDQLVKESTQTIVPNGAVASEFHVAKPDGWPAGEYEVEILLNGNEVASKDFKVDAG